eukprot:gene20100-26819_t
MRSITGAVGTSSRTPSGPKPPTASQRPNHATSLQRRNSLLRGPKPQDSQGSASHDVQASASGFSRRKPQDSQGSTSYDVQASASGFSRRKPLDSLGSPSHDAQASSASGIAHRAPTHLLGGRLTGGLRPTLGSPQGHFLEAGGTERRGAASRTVLKPRAPVGRTAGSGDHGTAGSSAPGNTGGSGGGGRLGTASTRANRNGAPGAPGASTSSPATVARAAGAAAVTRANTALGGNHLLVPEPGLIDFEPPSERHGASRSSLAGSGARAVLGMRHSLSHSVDSEASPTAAGTSGSSSTRGTALAGSSTASAADGTATEVHASVDRGLSGGHASSEAGTAGIAGTNSRHASSEARTAGIGGTSSGHASSEARTAGIAGPSNGHASSEARTAGIAGPSSGHASSEARTAGIAGPSSGHASSRASSSHSSGLQRGEDEMGLGNMSHRIRGVTGGLAGAHGPLRRDSGRSGATSHGVAELEFRPNSSAGAAHLRVGGSGTGEQHTP